MLFRSMDAVCKIMFMAALEARYPYHPPFWLSAMLPTLAENFCVSAAEAIAQGRPVVVGSNGRVAWGFTDAYADTGDLIEVEINSIAHSLYKAHAFLASGTAVETVAAIRRPGPVAIPNGRAALVPTGTNSRGASSAIAAAHKGAGEGRNASRTTCRTFSRLPSTTGCRPPSSRRASSTRKRPSWPPVSKARSGARRSRPTRWRSTAYRCSRRR